MQKNGNAANKSSAKQEGVQPNLAEQANAGRVYASDCQEGESHQSHILSVPKLAGSPFAQPSPEAYQAGPGSKSQQDAGYKHNNLGIVRGRS